MLPAIFGLSGPALTEAERAFFREADPAGFILFARNCTDRAQLAALTADLRAAVGRDLPILIDQEGGRVARLRPPEWPAFPAARDFATLYEAAPLSGIEAARLNGLALAAVLREVGVNVNCVPVLDVPQPDAHDIIGDRAYGAEPMRIAALAGATLGAMQAGGVQGVLKHLPGHGRARADSHLELPVVDASADALETDLAPFVRLAGAGAMGMTGHVVYTAWDAERCASVSPAVIGEVIRGRIGFGGLLMSDDLGMKALDGPMGGRAAAVIAAGCDLALHCSGEMAEMEAVAAALATIGAESAERLERAMAPCRAAPPGGDALRLAAARDALLGLA